MRPTLPDQFDSTHRKLSQIMQDTWDIDPGKRPAFSILLDTLKPCFLWYTLNDDTTAINMWSRYFKDKIKVSMDEFLAALWKSVNGTDPPNSTEESFIYLRCVEAVINAPGVPTEEVSLDRFGLFVHWYGPLLPLNGEALFFKIETLLRAEWYHGELSGNAAEDLLRTKTGGGDYLVRCSSSTQAPFTMSRVVNNSLVHYRILYNRISGIFKMKYHTKKDSDNIITGTSLSDFVKHASKILGLKSPVKCIKYQSLFGKQRTVCLGYEPIAFPSK